MNGGWVGTQTVEIVTSLRQKWRAIGGGLIERSQSPWRRCTVAAPVTDDSRYVLVNSWSFLTNKESRDLLDAARVPNVGPNQGLGRGPVTSGGGMVPHQRSDASLRHSTMSQAVLQNATLQTRFGRSA